MPDVDTTTLPEPGDEQKAHSEKLAKLIAGEIAAHGDRITFAHFMDLALYAPGMGYYQTRNPFGPGGDYVTAAHISPVFARCLADQCVEVFQSCGPHVLEFGAGDGRLAADLLISLRDLHALPDSYAIVELSPVLKEIQRDTIKRAGADLLERVSWLDRLPASFDGVVLANEVIDAMPVHLFTLAGDTVLERYVAWQNNTFTWHDDAASDERINESVHAIKQHCALGDGYLSEVHLAAESWIHSLGAMLQRGVILLIDYGFPRHEYYHEQRRQGTLICHYRHRSHPDPFYYVGLQDITAHVDFTAVADAAVEAGLHVAGYTSQAFFLINTGLEKWAHEALNHNDPDRIQFNQAIMTLTMPNEMGELFKVMALTRQFDNPLKGFQHDLRSKLVY